MAGEMMDQWMRGNSSDGSNRNMTGWFWKRGVGCLRCLGLDGGVFCFAGFWAEWGRKIGGGLYGGRGIGKWLAERNSWLGKRYDERFLHRKWVN